MALVEFQIAVGAVQRHQIQALARQIPEVLLREKAGVVGVQNALAVLFNKVEKAFFVGHVLGQHGGYGVALNLFRGKQRKPLGRHTVCGRTRGAMGLHLIHHRLIAVHGERLGILRHLGEALPAVQDLAGHEMILVGMGDKHALPVFGVQMMGQDVMIGVRAKVQLQNPVDERAAAAARLASALFEGLAAYRAVAEKGRHALGRRGAQKLNLHG